MFYLGYVYHVTTAGSLRDELKCDNQSVKVFCMPWIARSQVAIFLFKLQDKLQFGVYNDYSRNASEMSL